MAMEINGNYSHYKTNYAQMQAGEEKVKEAEKEQNDTKAPDKIPTPQDEYISSEKSGAKPSGLYRLGQDEDGRKKVFYDEPRKSDNVAECTANTDEVDREIEKLKEQKRQLEQQIKNASGDEEKVKELEKKLSQIERELSRKDNDTYRRQHTIFS